MRASKYNVHLRDATLDDLELLEDLEVQIFPADCLNSRSLEGELKRGFGGIYELEGRPVGYFLCRREHNLVDLLRLGILPGHRGKGIGQFLLKVVLMNSLKTMLTVRRDNEPALRLYRKHGFVIVGELDPAMPAWVMIAEREEPFAG